MIRYCACGYPQWVRDTVDNRLLALHRIPETAYERLRAEEAKNQKAFDKIVREAECALGAQDIPERIKSQMSFHDACLLALKKNKADMELYLRKDGGWFDGKHRILKLSSRMSPYLSEKKGLPYEPKEILREK